VARSFAVIFRLYHYRRCLKSAMLLALEHQGIDVDLCDDSPMSNQTFTGAIVRSADSRDILAIGELIERVWADPTNDMKCLAGESCLTARDLPAFFADPDNLTLAHVFEDVLTGVLFLTRVAPTVFDLGVVATPAGNGAGTRLLDAAIDLSLKDAITTEIYLDVFARNPAVHLYERKGFKEYDRITVTNQRGEALTLLRMRLILRTFSDSRASRNSSPIASLIASIASTASMTSIVSRIFSVIRKLAASKDFL
jgi:GNAT superfamily N-acetyltransferase